MFLTIQLQKFDMNANLFANEREWTLIIKICVYSCLIADAIRGYIVASQDPGPHGLFVLSYSDQTVFEEA